MIAQQITSQFPAFCKDSLLLYSNMGTPLQWKKFNPPNSWSTIGATSTDKFIYTSGKYLYTKSNACGAVADTIEILPVVNVIANASDTSICIGESTTLNGSGALTYLWSGGIIDNQTLTPQTTQIYTVTGTDADGCSNSSSIKIVVNVRPLIFNLKSTPTYICSEGNALLGIGPVSATSITWLPLTFLNSNTGLYVDVHNINVTTTYTVAVTDHNGCMSVDSITIPVFNSSTATFDSTVCSNDCPFFWNGQALSSTGKYEHHEVNSNGCDSLIILNLTVNPSPQPSILYQDHNLICGNAEHLDLQWFFNDLLSDEAGQVLYSVVDGNYKVIATSAVGCTGTSALQVSTDMVIFPNPASGVVNIKYPLNSISDVSIALFDIDGRILHTFLNEETQNSGFYNYTADLTKLDLESGVYFFRIKLGLDTYVRKLLYH